MNDPLWHPVLRDWRGPDNRGEHEAPVKGAADLAGVVRARLAARRSEAGLTRTLSRIRPLPVAPRNAVASGQRRRPATRTVSLQMLTKEALWLSRSMCPRSGSNAAAARFGKPSSRPRT